jgi:hypothetical protein
MAVDDLIVTWAPPTGAQVVFGWDPYRVGNLTGWDDLPPARVDDNARPNAHGSFDAPVWAGPRTVTLEGYCIDPAGRSTLLTALTGSAAIAGDASSGALTVAFAGRTLAAAARMTRSAMTIKNWGVGNFGWAIEWWCPDPVRYGPGASASTPPANDPGGLVFPLGSPLDFGPLATLGRLALTNPGSAPSYPRFTVTGPLVGGFELVEVNSGRRIRLERDVPDGSTVVIDAKAGSVSFDGSGGYEGYLTSRQWFAVPPVGAVDVLFTALGAPDPSALLTVEYAPAFW